MLRRRGDYPCFSCSQALTQASSGRASPHWGGHPLVKTQRIPGPDVALVLLQARPVLRQDDTRLPGRNYSSLLSSLILSQKKEEGSGVPRQETGSS